MSEPVLSLRSASLSLQGNAGLVRILDAITLDVHRGETIGLVGPSGSGKSSLLMLMGGLERATSGEVRALGHDLSAMNEFGDVLTRIAGEPMEQLFRRKIGRASCRKECRSRWSPYH